MKWQKYNDKIFKIFDQTWLNISLCGADSNFYNYQPFNSQKGDNDHFSLNFLAKSLLCANVFIDKNCFSGE